MIQIPSVKQMARCGSILALPFILFLMQNSNLLGQESPVVPESPATTKPIVVPPATIAKPPMKSAELVSLIRSRLSPIAVAQLSQYVTERNALIDRVLIPGGIKDPRAIEAIRNTPRHTFVPDALKDQAYIDRALPIGEAQTISSPFIVARMTEALAPKQSDKVLEIGTGSGYQASVLSPLVKDVFTIEIVEPIAIDTEKFLKALGYVNIHTKVGDGFLGWPEMAPFDKIIVTCSPEKVPEPLVEQLAEGGLMVIPVGKRYQQLLYIYKKVDGKLQSTTIEPTLFVPMTGQAEENRVEKESKSGKLINGDFEERAKDGNYIPGWYYDFNAELVRDPDSPSGSQVIEFTSNKGDLPSMLIQGFRLDGRQTPIIRMKAAVMTENVVPGEGPNEKPMVLLRMLDENREPVGEYWLGFYTGTNKWRVDQQTVRVPPNSREALVQIGLFGATGKIRFDGITIEARRR